jgi:hypothetical protein
VGNSIVDAGGNGLADQRNFILVYRDRIAPRSGCPSLALNR